MGFDPTLKTYADLEHPLKVVMRLMTPSIFLLHNVVWSHSSSQIRMLVESHEPTKAGWTLERDIIKESMKNLHVSFFSLGSTILPTSLYFPST